MTTPYINGNGRVRLFYDKDNKLFGILPDVHGDYHLNEGRLTCRLLPKNIEGKFPARWDEEKKMIIADLNSPIVI